jgi:hypothetical protein
MKIRILHSSLRKYLHRRRRNAEYATPASKSSVHAKSCLDQKAGQVAVADFLAERKKKKVWTRACSQCITSRVYEETLSNHKMNLAPKE